MGILKNNDFFGDPSIFLKQALKNSYMKKPHPQIIKKLIDVCKELGISYEKLEDELLLAKNSSKNVKAFRNSVPYTHTLDFHNLKSPKIIAKEVYPILQPSTVLEVGCGIGTFARAFHDLGSDVIGLDGPWVERRLLRKYLNENQFIETNLTKKFDLNRRFDLVVCLEVAEHLPRESAALLIEGIVKHGDVILFSAATPQTWFDSSHLNNQWPNYWASKFKAKGFVMHDVLRHIFFKNPDVFPWYRHNMFLVTKDEKNELAQKFLDIKKSNIRDMWTSDEFYPFLS